MSYITTLRNKLAAALFVQSDPSTTTKDKQQDNSVVQRSLSVSERNEQPVVGHISSDDIHLLNSDQSKFAVADQGMFIALSKTFNLLDKGDEAGALNASEEFRAWNTCIDATKPRLQATAVAERVKAYAKAPPRNLLTQEMAEELAEVTGIPAATAIAEEQAANLAVAARRQALMHTVYNALTSHAEAGSAAQIKASVAISAIRRKAVWVGKWTNIIAKVAEIRDMKTDIDMLTVLGRASEQDDGSKFVDGVMTADALFNMQEELTTAHKAGESAKGYPGYEPDALAEAYKERDAANLDNKLSEVRRRRVIKQAA